MRYVYRGYVYRGYVYRGYVYRGQTTFLDARVTIYRGLSPIAPRYSAQDSIKKYRRDAVCGRAHKKRVHKETCAVR
jgi:hypothetical protein